MSYVNNQCLWYLAKVRCETDPDKALFAEVAVYGGGATVCGPEAVPAWRAAQVLIGGGGGRRQRHHQWTVPTCHG